MKKIIVWVIVVLSLIGMFETIKKQPNELISYLLYGVLIVLIMLGIAKFAQRQTEKAASKTVQKSKKKTSSFAKQKRMHSFTVIEGGKSKKRK